MAVCSMGLNAGDLTVNKCSIQLYPVMQRKPDSPNEWHLTVADPLTMWRHARGINQRSPADAACHLGVCRSLWHRCYSFVIYSLVALFLTTELKYVVWKNCQDLSNSFKRIFLSAAWNYIILTKIMNTSELHSHDNSEGHYPIGSSRKVLSREEVTIDGVWIVNRNYWPL